MSNYKLSNKVCPEGMTTEEWQVALRREAARRESFTVEHLDNGRIWGDYLVRHGNNSYKVAFRGVESDWNYCSCLDFRTTGLGTCKHIESVVHMLENEVGGYPWGGLVYRPAYSSIYVSYKGGRKVRFSCGVNEENLFRSFRKRYFGEENLLDENDYPDLDKIAAEGLRLSDSFRCYEDVYEIVDEVVSTNRWRQVVLDTFPEKKMDTIYAATCGHEAIQSELYDLLLQGNGIMVGESTHTLRKEIIAMASFIVSHEEGPAVIVSSSVQTLGAWQSLIAHSPLAAEDRIYIFSQEDFDATRRLPAGRLSFLFVENSDVLKEWANPLSILIKRLSIKHLYMHLPTLSKLSPVQFSSITQHISPYLLAPFYRFINDFRSSFPLSDMGDNLPEMAHSFVFTRNQTRSLTWREEASDHVHEEDAELLVSNFMSALTGILQNPQAVTLLQDRLSQLSPKPTDQ